MRKLVISGSLSLENKIKYWVKYFDDLNYEVLNYPKKFSSEYFLENYSDIYKDFLVSISNSDILFVMNEDKNGIKGYIGAASYAELCFAISQNLLYDKKIEIYLYQRPGTQVQCYNEIAMWLNLGKVKIWNK